MPLNPAVRIVLVALATVVLFSTSHAASAGAGEIARGRALAIERCAPCHAVERTGTSPYAPAPPFRTLHERYDVEGLAEAFAEGITVPHKGVRQMPRFRLISTV
jgi:cytochrome c